MGDREGVKVMASFSSMGCCEFFKLGMMFGFMVREEVRGFFACWPKNFCTCSKFTRRVFRLWNHLQFKASRLQVAILLSPFSQFFFGCWLSETILHRVFGVRVFLCICVFVFSPTHHCIFQGWSFLPWLIQRTPPLSLINRLKEWGWGGSVSQQRVFRPAEPELHKWATRCAAWVSPTSIHS